MHDLGSKGITFMSDTQNVLNTLISQFSISISLHYLVSVKLTFTLIVIGLTEDF